MLSINPIDSANHALDYFMGAANYYIEEGEKSRWWGKGAAKLGLNGTVDIKDFSQLLEGKLPSGQLLGKFENGKRQYRPGFDLTFSIPKSLSIIAVRGDDQKIRDQIIQASFNAVQKTMNIIEENCACARITKEGNTYFVNTGNLVVALHLHDLSRENEGDIHIHAVVMNTTERTDKMWRALGSQEGYYGKGAKHEINGFFERVGHQKKQFGAIFRSFLAHDLKQQGFPIVVTNRKEGFFDVQGISKELMEAHSTRTFEKNAFMEEHGLSGGKAAALAVKMTRPPKIKKEKSIIEQEWLRKEASKGVDAKRELSAVIEAIKFNQNTLSNNDVALKEEASSITAQEAVQYVIDVLSETQIKMRPIEIINKAINDSGLAVDEITKVIDQKRSDGELILIEKNKGELYYTTKELLETEKAILNALGAKIEKKLKPKKIEAYLNQINLSQEKKQAIMGVFSSDKRISALEGASQTGKTSLIKPMAKLAKAQGMMPIILTPNKAGAIEIKHDLLKSPSKIKQFMNTLFDSNRYYSVSSFIFSAHKQAESGNPLYKNACIFVDNAQTLSLKTIHELIMIAEQNQARLVPIFDQKSLLSWQSGNPLLQMLNHGMETEHLTRVRIKSSGKLQTVVTDTLKNNIEAAFDKLGNNIIEIEDKKHRYNRMGEMYSKLDDKERENSIVIMPTKAQCDEMNLIIREELKKEQKLDKDDVIQEVLIPKSLKKAEYRQAKNYQVGQWVRFNEDYASLHVKKGDYRQITRISPAINQILFEDSKGKTVEWNPNKLASKYVEVFNAEKRAVSIGDNIVWRRNHQGKGLTSGEKLKVVEIKANKLTLVRENNKKVSIDLRDNQNKHFDYLYALTPFQALDRKVDHLIAYQNAYSSQSHQRIFYKIISVANQDAWIFTENKEALLRNVQKYTGDKSTVIDTLLKDVSQVKATSFTIESRLGLTRLIVDKIQELKKDDLSNKTPDTIAKEALAYAIAHLSERETVFDLNRLFEVALKRALGDLPPDEITQAISNATKIGELIDVDKNRVTTQEMILLEREIITLAKKDQGQLVPILKQEAVAEYLASTTVKEEHAHALYEWMGSQDRTVIIQGDAGTGKTTLLTHVNALKHAADMLPEGYQLLALAPTHSVVDELKSRGLNAQTLDSFLSEQSEAKAKGKLKQTDDRLIIAVDENSMISNRKERDFLSIINEIKGRAAFIGDSRQYGAIESGKPHTLLQAPVLGIKTIYLTDIIRQKNAVLIEAVDATYTRDFKSAFDILKDNIVEIGRGGEDNRDNKKVRLNRIAKDYLSLTSLERANTGIITISNEDRIALNDLIRSGLKKSGELSGKAITTTVLVSKDMTKVEHSRAGNFEKGDIIRFGVNDTALKIKKGDYLTVNAIHEHANLLTLKKQSGQEVLWQPKYLTKDRYSGIEVFKRSNRQLMSGDLIRWRRTDKELGLISPEMAKVISFDNQEAILQPVRITVEGIAPKGDPFKIGLSKEKYQHWDYAHVITSFASQSKDFNKVMVNMQSYSLYGSSQVAFLIAITRAIEQYTLYTDNKSNLLEQIENTLGDKESALEATKEIVLTNNRANQRVKYDQQNKVKSSNRQIEKEDNPHQKPPIYYDVHQILSELHFKAEVMVKRILGEPKSRSATHFQYSYSEQFGGENTKQEGGSLSVAISGDKQGLWKCFKTGEGGNMLGLIQKKFNLDFKESLTHAAHILGYAPHQNKKTARAKKTTVMIKSVDKSDPKNWTNHQKNMVLLANKRVQESIRAKGTLVEKYLSEHRKIDLSNIPFDIRFHERISAGKGEGQSPALIAIARNEKGNIQRIQVIYLDEKTAAKNKKLDVNKRTYGVAFGSSVNLSRNIQNKQVTYLAEGIETGLSILQSMDNGNVEVVLGKENFKHPNLKNISKNVVLCIDNDGQFTNEKAIHEAAKALSEAGKTVWIAKPIEPGKDYNDVLKEQGEKAVRTNIEQAILYHDYVGLSVGKAITLKEILPKIRAENHQTLNQMRQPQAFLSDLESIENYTSTPIKNEPKSISFTKEYASIDHEKTTKFNIDDIDKELLSRPLSDKRIPNINSTVETTKSLNKVKEMEHEI